MGFSIGIVGLPNVGKSTLFKALTKKQVDIAAYPFTTISPNVGVVAVPDERLEKLAQILKPQKVTPTIIEFVDIAGLVKGAHKGEGLGNQFLAHIRNCDAICEVVRTFETKSVEHVEKDINPERDIEIIKTELAMKDLEMVEKLLQKLEKETKAGDKKVIKKVEILKLIKRGLEEEKPENWQRIRDDETFEEIIKESNLLTVKPILYVFNITQNSQTESNLSRPKLNQSDLVMDLKMEEEISELTTAELKELEVSSQLDQFILGCYNILNLITFFTVAGGKEIRAWTVVRGASVRRAGGCIHSDFEEKFIKGEVISWEKLVQAQSQAPPSHHPHLSLWVKAKELGWIKTVGKDYVVQDGDVIEYKI